MIILGAIVRPGLSEANEAEEPTQRYGCGVVALATLFRLEGKQLDLDESVVTTASETGRHSMAQLREAARVSGVRLIGVHLSDDPSDLDRPALVYLDRGEHGHFIVIRPVGHSGTLLQVLDVQGPPAVVDGVALYDSPEWTGVALVRSQGGWMRRSMAAVFTSVVVVWVVWLAMRRFGLENPIIFHAQLTRMH